MKSKVKNKMKKKTPVKEIKIGMPIPEEDEKESL